MKKKVNQLHMEKTGFFGYANNIITKKEVTLYFLSCLLLYLNLRCEKQSQAVKNNPSVP